MNALWMRHSPGTPAHRFAMVLIAAGALSACASGPKVPDWKIQSIGHVERFTAAYLKGDSRVEAREFDLARAETAGTGRPDLVARIELNRIAAPEGAYDYQNKYFTDDVKYHCPSGLPEAEEMEIRRITLAAFLTLGCRGWGRADIMIRASDRKPFLLEMNTSPGMTTHSLVPMSARAMGIPYEELCMRVLATASLDAQGIV